MLGQLVRVPASSPLYTAGFDCVERVSVGQSWQEIAVIIMTISHEFIPELQTDDHLYPGVVAERSASTLDIDSPTITDLP
jgi:hypothetical protein